MEAVEYKSCLFLHLNDTSCSVSTTVTQNFLLTFISLIGYMECILGVLYIKCFIMLFVTFYSAFGTKDVYSKWIANKMAKNSITVKWCKRQGNKSSLKCQTQWWALSSLFPLRNESGNTAQSSGEAYKARKRPGSTGKEKKYKIKNVNMLLYTYIFLLHLE